MKTFLTEDRAILTALGVSDKAIEHLESMGITSKKAIANIGSAETLSAMSGINSNAAMNVYNWSIIDFNETTEDSEDNNSLDIDFSEAIAFSIEPFETYDNWIKEALSNDELNDEYLDTIKSSYTELIEGLNINPEDANVIYNFGRALRIALDPAVDKAYDNEYISDAATTLIKTAEAYFKKAIELFNGFGRARTMYASLLCLQKRFNEAITIVEPALELPEGSEDWMIAAHWYLAAKAYLNDTFGEAAEIYHKFENYAVEGSNHHRFISNFLTHHY